MNWTTDFPNIRWEWRVFVKGILLTHIEANAQEIAIAQTKLALVLDWTNHTIDLL